MGLGHVLAPLVDLVFPPRCPLCGAAIGSAAGLCANCWSTLAIPGDPACAACQRPRSLRAMSVWPWMRVSTFQAVSPWRMATIRVACMRQTGGLAPRVKTERAATAEVGAPHCPAFAHTVPGAVTQGFLREGTEMHELIAWRWVCFDIKMSA